MAKKDEVQDESTPDTLAVNVGVAVGVDDLSYGDHRNQRFGNLPENPKHAPGTENEETVLMGHKTNNIAGVGTAYANVPKSMVGDYARAGWGEMGAAVDLVPNDTIGQGTGPTDDKAGEKTAKLTADIAAGKVAPDVV